VSGKRRSKTASPGRYLWLIALAAVFGASALAPATAMAKKVTFKGPVNQPFIPSPAGFAVDPPTMELKVKFVGQNPTYIAGGSMKSKGIYGTCVFGAYGCSAYKGEAPQCFWANGEVGDDVKIKNKRFSVTYRDPGSGGDYLAVTGRVSKKSVTGTVHGYASIAATTPDAAGNGGHPAATCDTGVLTWTATR
jgi:hypothetical protein